MPASAPSSGTSRQLLPGTGRVPGLRAVDRRPAPSPRSGPALDPVRLNPPGFWRERDLPHRLMQPLVSATLRHGSCSWRLEHRASLPLVMRGEGRLPAYRLDVTRSLMYNRPGGWTEKTGLGDAGCSAISLSPGVVSPFHRAFTADKIVAVPDDKRGSFARRHRHRLWERFLQQSIGPGLRS